MLSLINKAEGSHVVDEIEILNQNNKNHRLDLNILPLKCTTIPKARYSRAIC